MFGGSPTYATWLSRDGMPQTYWGGATSRKDRYCACGEQGTFEWRCRFAEQKSTLMHCI